MLGRLHVIPPLFSKVETEFGTAQDSARDLAKHFGVWLKRGVKKNLLCVFHMQGDMSAASRAQGIGPGSLVHSRSMFGSTAQSKSAIVFRVFG